MEGEFVVYEGRKVPRAHFRAFVYGSGDKKKLVNSYDEFEAAMATGIWFPTFEECKTIRLVKRQKVAAETHDEFLANAK